MEDDYGPLGGAEHQSLISTDLEPLYLLTEADYQQVVIQLTNAVIGSIERLRVIGSGDEARLLAEDAHEVLLNFDDDVADYVLRLGVAVDEGTSRIEEIADVNEF